jgi:putative hydrolase
MNDRIAFDEDFHVHSTFSDGASTMAENVRVARERRLRTLCLVDHVRADTDWLPEFARAVTRYRSVPGLRVLAGVEAKMLDMAGRLDVPPDLDRTDAIDLVLIADHQFPGRDGPVHPAVMRAAITGGEVTAGEAIEGLAMATIAALGGTRRGLLAHPFSLLPKMGLDEEQVPAALLTEVAAAAVRAGALVEVNEKWRCPAPRTVAALASAGVHLVAGSDSHHCRDIGVYDTVQRIVRSASVTALRSRPRPAGTGRDREPHPAGSTAPMGTPGA